MEQICLLFITSWSGWMGQIWLLKSFCKKGLSCQGVSGLVYWKYLRFIHVSDQLGPSSEHNWYDCCVSQVEVDEWDKYDCYMRGQICLLCITSWSWTNTIVVYHRELKRGNEWLGWMHWLITLIRPHSHLSTKAEKHPVTLFEMRFIVLSKKYDIDSLNNGQRTKIEQKHPFVKRRF